MKNNEKKKQMQLLENQMTVNSRNIDLCRAHAINIGHATGGVTEISMRGGPNGYTWIILQPVEVIELIHQLAGNVGCHIHIQPRMDFSSWRAWNYTKEELEHYRFGGGQISAPENKFIPPLYLGAGCPPITEDKSQARFIGSLAPEFSRQPPKQEIKNESTSKEKEKIDEQVVATKKNIHKRKPKRTPNSS